MKIGMKVTSIAACALLLVIAIGLTASGSGQRSNGDGESVAEAQWEYLVVAGGQSNLSTAGNENYPNMRKQSDTSFNREAFTLERNFDKLGAKGWELVDVYGPPNDPVYYFKKHKSVK
ncbi:MAG: hypothetical protein L0220_21740 [Acidobacteria bacterium]|nr:hypothetical protein [Acidobacteriota bacterium]